jgi:hypothetical protein
MPHAGSSRLLHRAYEDGPRAVCWTRERRSDLYQVVGVAPKMLTLSQGSTLPEGAEIEVWLFPHGRPSVWRSGRVIRSTSNGPERKLTVVLEHAIPVADLD